jgi:hypothetical protein
MTVPGIFVPHKSLFRAFAIVCLVFTAANYCNGFQCMRTCATSCCCPTVCAGTVFTAGNEPGDLKVHIVGSKYDTIEAYFKNELFYRETFAKTCSLQCGSNVALAPANAYGTFAVRFGTNHATVRVYGWKKDQEKPEIKELTLDPDHAVTMTWMTTRILKVAYGSCQSKEYILRFNDADNAWTELYKSP